MPEMTCKLNGLFSIGEDFDDEELLGTDWTVHSATGPGPDAAAVSSSVLRTPSVALGEPDRGCLQQTVLRSVAQSNGTEPQSSTHTAVGQTVGLGLRQLSSSTPFGFSNPPTNLSTTQSHGNTEVLLEPSVAQDEFDDWDVDLADLDECDDLVGHPSPPAPTTRRPTTCGRIQTPPDRTAASQPSNHILPRTLSSPQVQAPAPRSTFPSAPQQSPGVFPGLTASSPALSPISRTLTRPNQPQRQWSTPRPSPQARGLFETVSPAPPSSSSLNSTVLSPHPLHTPVLTNRLVQLVSASSKFLKKRPRSEPQTPRTRRFPGPAGLLPQQPQGQSLDDIVVSVPYTPAHGVVARLPSQVSSSQAAEDEFSGGAWAAMKAEMGLDERNASCFLRSYSVVMVLRKAALKQLVKNKVPNMAVLLKSIIHTHADAKAVFKDPTGEIQGTVHRRLLEDRAEELKVGAVLLLKQVGVFSPSHRNHYLNVTPNNLLRIYTSDGVSLSSTQLPPLVLEPVLQSPTIHREPVSRMHLVFDEEDDEGQEGERSTEGDKDLQAPTGTRVSSSRVPEEPVRNIAQQDQGWDADDDLDELLGELPEDTYNF